MPAPDNLSRRERQIMDVLYTRATEGGEGATAEDVEAALPDPPTRTAIRTFLRILESRGLLRHDKRGRAFVYRPTRPAEKVGKSALRRVVETFFGGSLEKALAAHLTDPTAKLTDDQYLRLKKLIEEAHNKR